MPVRVCYPSPASFQEPPVFRATAFLLLACTAAVAQPRDTVSKSAALTKEFLATDSARVVVGEKTRDAASRNQVVVIHAEYGEKVALRPGETVVFKVEKGAKATDFTKSGGWYWSAGSGLEQSRLRGADTIKAVRDEKGYIDWYRVEWKK